MIYFVVRMNKLNVVNNEPRSLLLVFQYVVIPTRRSTAEAFQILISHALGDAGSPYLVGVVSCVASRYHSPVKHYITVACCIMGIFADVVFITGNMWPVASTARCSGSSIPQHVPYKGSREVWLEARHFPDKWKCEGESV